MSENTENTPENADNTQEESGPAVDAILKQILEAGQGNELSMFMMSMYSAALEGDTAGVAVAMVREDGSMLTEWASTSAMSCAALIGAVSCLQTKMYALQITPKVPTNESGGEPA